MLEKPTKSLQPQHFHQDLLTIDEFIPVSTENHRNRRPAWLTLAAQPSIRLPVLLLLHAAIFSVIYSFSFGARYDFLVPTHVRSLLLSTLPVVVLVKVLTFYATGHFHGWWRYVTFADLLGLLRASLLSMMLIIFIDHVLLSFDHPIPRLVILLDTLLTILVIGSLRSLWRMLDEQFRPVINRDKYQNALLVGSDYLAGQLAGQINSQQTLNLRVKAFLAIGNHRKKARLGHICVAGGVDDVERVAARCKASIVLVTAGAMPGRQLRQLVERCNAANLELKILPRLDDVLRGSARIPIRPLAINDLLRRDPVTLDDRRIEELVRGRRVLVTGAGGSIGSEICRQVMRFAPGQLMLLGRGENRIFTIESELRRSAGTTDLIPIIGNVADHAQMQRLFADYRPEIVFHAAAHKHVPLMERHVGEAIRNNVLGTRTIAQLADDYEVQHFVMVSTDKAVNPTSVMGCTKQLAERVVHSYSRHSRTKFVVVRFGNVLGSAGSVVPVFQEQIQRGGPITITDPRMTRYFMSIPEAAQLVLQSAAMCSGGEVFVLDMGEPVKIIQLAEDLISLSGLPPGSIEFDIVGARPGEKLYEELYFDEEQTIPTPHEKVRAAYPRDFQGHPIHEAVDRLAQMLDAGNEALRVELKHLIPEYQLPERATPAKSLRVDAQQPTAPRDASERFIPSPAIQS